LGLSYSNGNGQLSCVKAVIFDFDGVILESADIKTVAFVEMFDHRPDLQPAILAHHLDNLGVSRYDKFAWIYRELLDRPFTAEVRAQMGRDFSALVLEKILACPFVPGALETLEGLAGRMPLFVASGTPQGELDLIVERRGLGRYFKGVWGSPRKKADIIQGIVQEYELTPCEVLMVGDGASDYMAAVETELHFLARNTAEHSAYWQAQEVPFIMEDLRGFVGLIGRV
jgi:phosphoglycolate phosphatase-like HAD superfamily hydrolase